MPNITLIEKCQLITTYLNATTLETINPFAKKLHIEKTIAYQEEACRTILMNIIAPHQSEDVCSTLYQKLHTASSTKNKILALFHLCYHGLYQEIKEIIQLISNLIHSAHPIRFKPITLKVLYLYIEVIFSLLKLNLPNQTTTINSFPRISLAPKEKIDLSSEFQTIKQKLIETHTQIQQQTLIKNISP